MRVPSLATLILLFCLYVSRTTAQSCDSNAVCIKTDAGFSCTCNSGYEGSSTGCTNVDECVSDTTCKIGETCTDTPGSYICHCGHNTSIRCGVNASCNAGTCVCNEGYAGDGFDCADVNECLSDQPCHEYATCNNTQGSYICACLSGFAGNGVSCTDVDECVEESDDCVSPLTCNNTLGGFACVCGDAENCDANAQCVMHDIITDNSSCVCNSGYAGNGTFCEDVDECLEANNCSKNAICRNNLGSHSCECKSGYTGDGFDCSGAKFLGMSWMTSCIAFVIIYSFIF